MNIVLIGKPGSGKGTISSFLKENAKLPYLSPGEIFRKEIQKGTELGKIAGELIDKGNFVPNDITNSLVKSALSEMKDGFIMDGFPRNMTQTEAFDNMLADLQLKINVVLHLYVDDQVIMDRLIDRQVCSSCQKTYHKVNAPSKVKDVCDDCGEMLVVREDDKPEYIHHRLKVYEDNTKPVVDYYEKRGLVITVGTNCSLEDMIQRIQNALNNVQEKAA